MFTDHTRCNPLCADSYQGSERIETKEVRAMKLITKGMIAGALMMLMVPAAAMANDGCYRGYGRTGWEQRDFGRDRRDLRNDERDVARDRYRLNQDLADGNWRAARAQRADINGDLRDIHRDRIDLHRDYQGFDY
jgi:hypothetical protein